MQSFTLFAFFFFQGAGYLLRGGKAVAEALIEVAKVAVTRGLMAAEKGKDSLLRNAPYVQQRVSQAYSSFMRGYESRRSSLAPSSGGGFFSYGQGQSSYGQSSSYQPSYQQQQQPTYGHEQQSSSQQQPSSQQQQPPQQSGG